MNLVAAPSQAATSFSGGGFPSSPMLPTALSLTCLQPFNYRDQGAILTAWAGFHLFPQPGRMPRAPWIQSKNPGTTKGHVAPAFLPCSHPQNSLQVKETPYAVFRTPQSEQSSDEASLFPPKSLETRIVPTASEIPTDPRHTALPPLSSAPASMTPTVHTPDSRSSLSEA